MARLPNTGYRGFGSGRLNTSLKFHQEASMGEICHSDRLFNKDRMNTSNLADLSEAVPVAISAESLPTAAVPCFRPNTIPSDVTKSTK
ncbi:hypothetical protein A0H81_03678 [Grifola frondosa]|uniref:Uncharacterized protein n=1 Tax=Grifola frondosa TaxID=5627 RepID=A0A1C7MKL3_GRIFR|nr:hypothetical protein A0H81_03678 [Grifola frondosa]